MLASVFNSNMVRKPAVLRSWPPDFGCPSPDPDSLFVMAYAKINECNILYTTGNIPQWKGIPSLTFGEGRIVTRINQILYALRHFIDDKTDTDRKYYRNEMPSIKAYKQYVIEELEVAILLVFWQNDSNYQTVTHRYFSAVIPFPFNRMFLRHQKKKTENVVAFLSGRITSTSFLNQKLERINQCLMDLSARLGENKFFMGSYPTSLDALVYSYLAPIYFAPLQNSAIKTKLHEQENLSAFINHMNKTYFPDVKLQYTYVNNEYRFPIWLTLLIGCIAGLIFFVFVAYV